MAENEKLTVDELYNAWEHLVFGEVGDYVETEGKKVEVVEMCGGRYMCFVKFHNEWLVHKLTDEALYCIDFLENYVFNEDEVEA